MMGVRWLPSSRPVWNEDRLAQLKRYYIDQGFSASQTAKLMGGVSRNAVIGAAHREGWTRSPELGRANSSVGTRQKATASPKPRKAKPPTNPAPLMEVRVFVAANPRHWTTRKSHECAWPASGDGADTFYCCAPVRPGAFWCEAHCRIGHMKNRFGILAGGEKELLRSLKREVTA